MSEYKEQPCDKFDEADGNLTALLDVLQLASWQKQEIVHKSISIFTLMMQKELQAMKEAFDELETEAEADRQLVAQFQAEAAIRADRATARKRQRARATL